MKTIKDAIKERPEDVICMNIKGNQSKVRTEIARIKANIS